MNKHTLVAVAVIIGGFIPSARSSTITFGTLGAQRTFMNDAGLSLNGPSNSLVWVGTFGAANSLSDSTFGNYSSISAAIAGISQVGSWRQFGLDSTGSPNPGTSFTLAVQASGKLKNSVIDTTTSPTDGAKFFDGKDVYLWVFNAATTGAATQMGIFRAPSVVNGTTPWVFPINGTVGDTANLDTDPANTPAINAIAGAGTISGTQLRLESIAAVPEPSTFAFGIVGAFAALSSRPRRRKE